jgi:hypothetical protein
MVARPDFNSVRNPIAFAQGEDAMMLHLGMLDDCWDFRFFI